MKNNIKVHIIHSGMVEVDNSLFNKNSSINPLAHMGIFRSKKHRVLIPVSSYLIEHSKGLVLIDTGWGVNFRNNSFEIMGIRTVASKAYVPMGWGINERLSKLGYKDSDIDYVVFSHLDVDHVGGISDVKNAKRFLVSKKEMDISKKDKLRYLDKLWKTINLETFEPIINNVKLDRPYYDLFDDGSLLLVETPGHSAGLISAIVRNNVGDYVVLASDVGYNEKSLTELNIPGMLFNKKEAVESLSWIKELSQSEKCKGIYFNHDPRINQQTIIL